MHEPAPIEIQKWPKEIPHPSFEDIQQMALACLGLSADNGVDKLRYNKTTPYILARQIIYKAAQHIKMMSSPEVVEAMNLSSHSVLVGRGATSAMRLIDSNVGAAMLNELIYCLHRHMHEHPRVFRSEALFKTAPGDYKKAARQALQGHAGAAV